MKETNQNVTPFYKIIIVMVLCICWLLGIRILLDVNLNNIKTLDSNDGTFVIDENDFLNYDIFHLDGTWKFYPNRLLTPEDINDEQYLLERVPLNWSNLLNESELATGVGTFKLNINLEKETNDILSLYFLTVHSAAKVYVDGELVQTMGKVSEDENVYVGEAKPFVASFKSESKDIEVIVQVANHELPNYGGILKSVKFGKNEKISFYTKAIDVMQIVLISLYLLHGLYGLIVFFMGNRRRQVVMSYIFIVIVATIAALFDGQLLGMTLIPIKLTYALKIRVIAYTMISLFILRTLQQLLPKIFLSKRSKTLIILHFLLILSIIILPFQYTFTTQILSSILSLVTFGFITYINIVNHFYDRKYSYILIFLNICLLSGTVSNIYFSYSNLKLEYFPFETIFMFAGLMVLIFKQTISERDEIERLTLDLKDANELKDILIYNMSNRFELPIHSVENMMKIIEEENDFDNSSEEKINFIIHTTQHMGILLDNLHDITRIQENELFLEKESVSIYSIVDKVIPIYQSQITDNIQIENNIDEKFPLIYADSRRIMQIISILIQNALHYTEQGRIVIRATINENEHLANIYINDEGVGVSEEIIEYIFTPGVRDIKRNSVGLDLYLCKMLVLLHGGTISVKLNKDKGSTFTIKLPLYDQEEHHVEKSKLMKNNFIKNDILLKQNHRSYRQLYGLNHDIERIVKGSKVLIIDNDHLNAQNMNYALNKTLDVTNVYSTKKALKLLEKKNYDIIISEILMPEISGLNLTRQLREKYNSFELPIILSSESNYNDERTASFIVGANDFMLKPVSTNEFRIRVYSLLAMRLSIQEHLHLEAALLQAQIKPHFLYNTLSTIMSLSYTDQKGMMELLEGFSIYLRKSFKPSNMENLISLEEELELVYSYLKIEKSRFDERLQLLFNIGETKDLFIPPFVLQTIVENAVRHGVLAKHEGGTIYVSLDREAKKAQLIVKDDGVGMTEDEISCILNTDYKEQKGIGLYNANNRLQRHFGQELKIESEKGKGTKITIYLPYRSDD